MIQVENSTPTMLLILDGFGYRKEAYGNAIWHAHMETWKKIVRSYPHTLLHASGRAVGLPEGFMGNSELGHLCMGAGRVIRTPFCKLHDSIQDKTFFENDLLIRNFKKLQEKGAALHVMGLFSDAGVHAHEDHMYAVLRLAQQCGVKKVDIHPFLDGRDMPPKSAEKHLQALQSFCTKIGCGVIASIHGRFFAMDRDTNWERTKKSYDVLCGRNIPNDFRNSSWQQVIKKFYQEGVTDEFIEPTLLVADGIVHEGDGIFFTNFRPDRARQLTQCFLDPAFSEFETCGLNVKKGTLAFFISTTRYAEAFKNFTNAVLFEDEEIKNTLLDEIARQNNKKIFIIAETEKYAHVTYFFRGKIDIQLPQETRVLIPSKKVKTFVNDPQMSAPQITQKLIESLETNPADFYLVNYANGDMVGHSGDFEATVKAGQCLDEQLKIVYEQVVEKMNGTIFLTADHGNAEEMIDDEGQPKTAHTTNPVPFVLLNKRLQGEYKDFEGSQKVSYGISNIAPTILQYLKLSIPVQMNQKTIDFI